MNKLFTTVLTVSLILLTMSVNAQIKFEKHSIATITTPLDVFVYDINGDGVKDILTADNGNGGELRLYKNNGDKTFSSSAITTGIGTPRSVRAGDIDGDGDTDIIAALFTNNMVSWWENDGTLAFERHDIDANFDGAHTVELCDLDMDGDMDVLCCEFDNSAAMSDVAWWENDGEQNWTKHVVSSRFQQATFVFGADMDNDGDNDLVASGELNGEIVWWKNDGSMNWTEIIIDNQFSKSHTIVPRDFDKDGDLDILGHACTSSLQAWYDNDGAGNFTKNSMETLAGAIWLDQGDFDNDGDYDLIGTGMGANQLVCYENDGLQNLTKQWVDGGLSSGFALNVADLDGDHDDDVVAIGYNSNTLAWWENISPGAVAFDEPKWMFRDKNSKQIFFANEGGSIGIVEPDGWSGIVRSGLPICSGIVKEGDEIWVNAGVELACFDEYSGIKKDGVRVPAQFLSGLAKSADGLYYATDPFSGNLIRINTISRETTTIKSDLTYPQSLRYDEYLESLIVLDGEVNTRVLVINPTDGSEVHIVETEIPVGGDIIGDGIGNYYLSSPQEGTIYSSSNGMNTDFMLYAENMLQPSGLAWNAEESKLVVMETGRPGITEIEANATGLDKLSILTSEVSVYPNPCSERFTLTNIDSKFMGGVLNLYSIKGSLVASWPIEKGANTSDLSFNLSNGAHPIVSGYYNLVLTKSNYSRAINVLIK